MLETLSDRYRELRRSFGAVPGRDMAVFFRCLYTTLESGVGIVPSLDLLSQQSENKELAEACKGLSRLVRGGNYLSVAMARYPWVFSNLHRRLVQVGEKTGALVQVLKRLSIHEEKQSRLNQKVRSSLSMPLFICATCFLLLIVIPPFLFKGLFQMLEDTHTALPWPTQILLFVAGLLRSPIFYVLFVVGVVGLVVFLKRAHDDPGVGLQLTRATMSVPILGPILRLVAVTRFLQALEIMMRVGLPILAALELAGGAADNLVLSELLVPIRERVKDGNEINQAMRGVDFFPKIVAHSIQAGEQSGQLVSMLESLNELYAVELDSAFDSFSQAIEPFVLCVMGFIVGFTVIATMLPMVRLIQNL